MGVTNCATATATATDCFSDDFHPYPFMREKRLPHRLQYESSQDDDVVFSQDRISSIQEEDSDDPHVLNPTLYSFVPSNNLHHQYCHHRSSEYPLINNTPTMEDVKSAMGGLCLSNNYPNPNPNYRNTAILDQLIYEMEELNRMRNMRVTTEIAMLSKVLVSLAKDPRGCLYLQSKIDEGEPEEVETILSEVNGHLYELMMHPFGNFLIQKIFQASCSTVTMKQMDSLVLLIILNPEKLQDACMDDNGTRAIQRMVENIESTFLMCAVVCTMKRITAALMKNVNGSYVIVHCLKLFPPLCQKVILDEVARNCVDIATDKIGCTVVQKCLTHADETAIIRLVSEIILNAVFLADDPYGNYVLQFLIELELPSTNERMIKELRENYVKFSKNKHASNVVEDLLKYSRQDAAAIIVKEIMKSDDFLDVLQDPFGNYVAQKALQCTKGRLQRELSDKIKSNHKNLRSHPYGKRVLAMAFTKGNRFRHFRV